MQTIDLITPLKSLLANAEKTTPTQFREGYIFALRHVIELAEVQQQRIDEAVAQEVK
jgi:hypothetical protein